MPWKSDARWRADGQRKRISGVARFYQVAFLVVSFGLFFPSVASADPQDHVRTLTLKNFHTPQSRGNGEYEYRSITFDVLAVHRNVVLKLNSGLTYADDAVDAGGHPYFIYMVFTKDGLTSMVTTAPGLVPVSSDKLTPGQKEILRETVRDLATSGCRVSIPASAPLEALLKLDLSPCVAQTFAKVETAESLPQR